MTKLTLYLGSVEFCYIRADKYSRMIGVTLVALLAIFGSARSVQKIRIPTRSNTFEGNELHKTWTFLYEFIFCPQAFRQLGV